MFLRGADKHGRESEKNLDLRIRKTRRAIRSGLVKACQAKPYAHVSVTDICAAQEHVAPIICPLSIGLSYA